jgi:CRISPR-associated protein Cas2
MLTVIAYDITDDRRRDAVSTLLADHGRRVNYSVFECDLEGEEFEQLQEQLAQRIDHRQDHIILYRLCEGCRPRTAAMGRTDEGESQGIIMV